MTSTNGVGGSAAPTSIRQIFQQARAAQASKLGPLSQLAQPSASSSPLQEANKTPAQTQLEAARGDQVAIRKLAQEKRDRQLLELKPAKSKGVLLNRSG